MLESAWIYSICTPATCDNCTGSSLALPPGWALAATADLTQASGKELPFLFLLEVSDVSSCCPSRLGWLSFPAPCWSQLAAANARPVQASGKLERSR